MQSKLARLCGEAATLRIQAPTRSRPAHRSVVGAPTPPTARAQLTLTLTLTTHPHHFTTHHSTFTLTLTLTRRGLDVPTQHLLPPTRRRHECAAAPRVCAYVESKLARTSVGWLSRGSLKRQSMPQALVPQASANHPYRACFRPRFARVAGLTARELVALTGAALSLTLSPEPKPNPILNPNPNPNPNQGAALSATGFGANDR